MNEALELELRQLPGVLFVGFAEDEGTTHIELVAMPSSEHARVRDEAARAAVNHLDGPAEIRVLAPPDDGPRHYRVTGWASWWCRPGMVTPRLRSSYREVVTALPVGRRQATRWQWGGPSWRLSGAWVP